MYVLELVNQKRDECVRRNLVYIKYKFQRCKKDKHQIIFRIISVSNNIVSFLFSNS